MKDRSSKKPQRPSAPDHERSYVRGVEHDHKGTAKLQWYDTVSDKDRRLLELEDKTQVHKPGEREIDTYGLTIRNEDSFDPYTRRPEAGARRGPGGRTDLRRLSAWIKMMRELEQARRQNPDTEDEDEKSR